MWRKIWFKRLLIFIIICIGIFLYFFSQHNIIIWKDSVDKTIELEDYVVKIEEISIHNYTAKSSYFDDQINLYKFAEKLPEVLRSPFIKMYYFFNKPYEINNKSLTIKLSGMIISNSFNDLDSEADNIWRNIKINIADEKGVKYSNSSRLSQNSSSNVVFFDIIGENFPVNRKDNLMTLTVTDKSRNDTHEFKFKPNYIKKTYNFYKKKPRKYSFNPVITVQNFIDLLKNNKMNQAKKYIISEKIENFPWSNLEQESGKMIKVYNDFPYYEGEYLDYKNVYSVKLYINKNTSQNLKEEYKVYLVDSDEGWKIIHISSI